MTTEVTYVNPPAEDVLKRMGETLNVHPFTVRCEGGDTIQNWGLSLRDYFAARAMQGDIAVNGLEGRDVEMVAGMSYEMADAMLKARERK